MRARRVRHIGRMTPTVLVTGAKGFIGSRLAIELARSGWEVRCLVRNASSPPALALREQGLELCEGDVLRPDTLRGRPASFRPPAEPS